MLGAEVEINETYVKTGQVKLLINPMLDHGDRSLQAHQAAECAGEQGQFWPIHDLFFEQQDALWQGDVRQAITDLAATLPLDQTSFQTCLAEQRYAGFVQTQDEQRKSLGIRTRPTITINDQTIIGPQPFATFQQVIEAELSRQN